MASRRKKKPVRGAAEFAIVFAALSFVLPARGLGLALLAAVIGFVVGLTLEIGLSRARSE